MPSISMRPSDANGPNDPRRSPEDKPAICAVPHCGMRGGPEYADFHLCPDHYLDCLEEYEAAYERLTKDVPASFAFSVKGMVRRRAAEKVISDALNGIPPERLEHEND